MKDLADDRSRFPGTRGREIDAALAVGGKVVRALQRAAILVLVVGRDRLAVARDAGDRAVVVAGDDEIARAERQHRGRAAAVALPQDCVGLAVPHVDRVAAILDIVKLAVDEGRAFRKGRLVVDHLDIPGERRRGGKADKQHERQSVHQAFLPRQIFASSFRSVLRARAMLDLATDDQTQARPASETGQQRARLPIFIGRAGSWARFGEQEFFVVVAGNQVGRVSLSPPQPATSCRYE